jgi:hypothetical protein
MQKRIQKVVQLAGATKNKSRFEDIKRFASEKEQSDFNKVRFLEDGLHSMADSMSYRY